MAITYIGGGTDYDRAVDSADLTIALPGGYQAGDVAILLITECLTTLSVIEPASGWTMEREDSTATLDDRETSIMYRVLTGSETDPVAIAVDVTNTIGSPAFVNRSANLMVFRGVDTANPIDVISLVQGTGSNPNPAAVTTTSDDAGLIIWNFPTRDRVTTVGLPSSPTGLSAGPEIHNTGNVQTITCYKENVGTAGTYDPSAWTNTESNTDAEYFNFTIALNAATAVSNMKVGSSAVTNAYVGSTAVTKIYVGSTLVLG